MSQPYRCGSRTIRDKHYNSESFGMHCISVIKVTDRCASELCRLTNRITCTQSPECQASKSSYMYETGAVSLFACLPTPTQLAAHGIDARTSHLHACPNFPNTKCLRTLSEISKGHWRFPKIYM